jgi:glycosyltransferase involved in cell wall biosynthesis
VPTVSIITPCYNAGRYIAATIESARQQSLSDWEMIVIDDGSTDHSEVIIRQYSSIDSRIRLIKQCNGGASNARNAGFSACSRESKYLLFLDADDCLEEHMLARLTAYLDSNRTVGMVYSAFKLIDADGEDLARDELLIEPKRIAVSPFRLRSLPDSEKNTSFLSLFSHWCGTLPSGSLIRRSTYEQTNGWDNEFPNGAEDTDVYLQLSLSAPIHFLPEALFKYRRHAAQATQDLREMRRRHDQLCTKWRDASELPDEHKRQVQ